MEIQQISTLSNIYGVRGKYGSLPLEFTSSQHLLQTGTKSKYALAFTNSTDRDTYFNQLAYQYPLFTLFDFSSYEPVMLPEETATFNILLEAKTIGIIPLSTTDLPPTSLNFTIQSLQTGSENTYKSNYQLALVALQNDNPLFTKLYPYQIKNNEAYWQINLASTLSPQVYTPLPSLAALTPPILTNNPLADISLRYGAAYEDDMVNNGRLTFYEMDTLLVQIANIKPTKQDLINGEYLDYFPLIDVTNPSTALSFLTLWDKSKSYLINRQSHHFLSFYCSEPNVQITIKTQLIDKYQRTETASETTLLTETGIYSIASGTINNLLIANETHIPLADLVSYSIEIEIHKDGALIATIPPFYFKVIENCTAYSLLYLNQLGVFDTIHFLDSQEEALQLDISTYLSNNQSDADTSTGGQAVTNITPQSQFKTYYQAGFNTPQLQHWIKDFLTSEQKYLIQEGQYYRVLETKKQHLLKQSDNKVLLEFEFTTNHPI